MHSVYLEVRVQRQDGTAARELRHADQTRVGQIHRHVGITRAELLYRYDLITESEFDLDGVSLEDVENHPLSSRLLAQQVASLDDDRLTGGERRLNLGEAIARPRVVTVSAVKHRYQRTGIENDLAFQITPTAIPPPGRRTP